MASFENAKDNLKALKETQFKDNIKFDLATSIYNVCPWMAAQRMAKTSCYGYNLPFTQFLNASIFFFWEIQLTGCAQFKFKKYFSIQLSIIGFPILFHCIIGILLLQIITWFFTVLWLFSIQNFWSLRTSSWWWSKCGIHVPIKSR